jgi:hypothetical protein
LREQADHSAKQNIAIERIGHFRLPPHQNAARIFHKSKRYLSPDDVLPRALNFPNRNAPHAARNITRGDINQSCGAAAGKCAGTWQRRRFAIG